MSLSSIWQRNLASTPCGLVIYKPRSVWSSCSGVPCLEGKNKDLSWCITEYQKTENLWFLGFTRRFGDLFGARIALTVACASTVVFFLLLAIADHPAMLFIHKLPTVFMHVLPGKQRSCSLSCFDAKLGLQLWQHIRAMKITVLILRHTKKYFKFSQNTGIFF